LPTRRGLARRRADIITHAFRDPPTAARGASFVFRRLIDGDLVMALNIDANVIMKALNWAYDKAVDGMPPMESAQELAEEYLAQSGTMSQRVDRFIKWQDAKCATSGFLTGLGGLIAMPVTIPMNLSSVMYVQTRMVAAIAYMGGHDLRNDRVRALAYASLTGNGLKDVVKDTGIVVGQKLTTQAIKNISGEVVAKINQRVGFRLLTKFGEKGAINIAKAIPMVGALIGATLDAMATHTIGKVAKRTFIRRAIQSRRRQSPTTRKRNVRSKSLGQTRTTARRASTRPKRNGEATAKPLARKATGSGKTRNCL
jgi:uncharacterized protein (DUF697 family)